jgi:ketosteroid isomerase-like protein
MSEENVKLVHSVLDGWSHGDFSVGADLLAPDFEWRQHAEAVEPGARRGVDIGGSLRRIFEIYQDFRVEPEEFLDAGEQVVVVSRVRATARGSGLRVDQRFTFVWTVREGQLVRNEVYSDREAALEAAGLSE